MKIREILRDGRLLSLYLEIGIMLGVIAMLLYIGVDGILRGKFG